VGNLPGEMSKDPLDKAADAIKKTADDVRDAMHESGHRSAAEGERAKRDVLGDEMTPGEKAGSALNEAKHRVQAEVDSGKRRIRDKT
jgi:hypothetical protein